MPNSTPSLSRDSFPETSTWAILNLLEIPSFSTTTERVRRSICISAGATAQGSQSCSAGRFEEREGSIDWGLSQRNHNTICPVIRYPCRPSFIHVDVKVPSCRLLRRTFPYIRTFGVTVSPELLSHTVGLRQGFGAHS